MSDSDKISKYFTLGEAKTSEKAVEKGIDNTIPKLIIPVVFTTGAKMDRVREFLAKPIHVNSWYRCLELNRLLGSKDTSQHVKGEAVDFICPAFGTPLQIARALVPVLSELEIDQLILEHTWIHTSFCANPSNKPRNHVLSLLADGSYASGLTDKQGNKLA